MKYLFILIVTQVIAGNDKNIITKNTSSSRSDFYLNDNSINNKMKIKIRSDIFTATLSENKTSVAFKAMLPLTLKMSELNGNEKYFQLSTDLPTNATEIGTIQEGDLMVWGTNTLVLFYKTFKTKYRYTKLGSFDNPGRLASAVGSGDVIISFQSE